MTDAQKAICVAWVKAHAHKWQVLNRAKWTYRFHEKTLVRYVDVMQMREDEVPLILDYLASDDCIATLSLYDQSVSAEWKPTRAWLEMTKVSSGAVHAVRLYHGLQTDPEADKDGPYLMEDGCVYKVWMTYYWRQPSVIEVPESTSGISYKLTGISRDQENGLYSYALEKRERVQQDVEEYFTSKSLYKDTTEEYHLGVRKDDIESTGHQASVGDGVLVHRKITKNSDCTSDVHNTTEIERPVSSASRTVSKTLQGTTVRIESRNQASPLSESGLSIGDSVTNSKTDGGLYNTVITTAGNDPAGKIAENCSQDYYTHRHSETDNVSEMAEVEHPFEVGQIVTQSSSLNSNGTANVTTNTNTAKPTIYKYHWNDANGRHYVVKYTNQPNDGTQYVPSFGYGIHVNDSVTEYGLHSGVVEWRDYPGGGGRAKHGYSFVKNGPAFKIYQFKDNPRGFRYCRSAKINLKWFRGDAYTEYVNAAISANPGRFSDITVGDIGDGDSEQTYPSGYLRVQLVGSPYSDSDGNLKCEWKGIYMTEWSGWTACTHDEHEDRNVGEWFTFQMMNDMLK